jgi:hypothetical protein
VVLGIAATALHDWPEAAATACVRLNPQSSGEVVWGERLDPARLVILNVPLPESRHRFRDIILNDGAENGTRAVGGIQVPVFAEFAGLKRLLAGCSQ